MEQHAGNGGTPREISYAFSAKSRAGKAVIRSIENLTGRPRLIRMAAGYETEVSAGRDFWEVMTERYRLKVAVDGAANIPADGPLIVVANHPYGILDGMALGRIRARRGAISASSPTMSFTGRRSCRGSSCRSTSPTPKPPGG